MADDARVQLERVDEARGYLETKQLLVEAHAALQSRIRATQDDRQKRHNLKHSGAHDEKTIDRPRSSRFIRWL